MDTLVTTEWLSQHLDESDLVVLDCSVRTEPQDGGGVRNVSGRGDYERGHIPNAGFADLKGDLCDPANPIEFAPPTPKQFCRAMGTLGVGDDTRVVLYDRYYSAWAARVWWMLRWVGFDRAALLDGGLKAWQAEGRPLSTEPVDRPPRRLTPEPCPTLIADRHEVRAAIENDAIHLIDTLPAPMFRGEQALYARAGHIPGAVNVCGIDLLDENGRFLPQDELANLFPGDRDSRTITYCGGGILASSNAFVLTRLGFTDVAVYTASLQEWAADPDNPMVTGSE
jgi:thiosulfate/3-mercaptopyruvate sulfurtransferase